MTKYSVIPLHINKASANAVKLYSILKSYCMDKQYCFPSQKTLSEDMGCTTRTVRRILEELIAIQAISIEPRYSSDGTQTTNIMRIYSEEPDLETPLPLDTSVHPPWTPVSYRNK